MLSFLLFPTSSALIFACFGMAFFIVAAVLAFARIAIDRLGVGFGMHFPFFGSSGFA
ncbi:MAG: hypothetical protein V4632_21640 [Pseudomonadota bacterium]